MGKISSFEWNRQLFHLLFGLGIVFLLVYDIIDKNIILTAVIAGFILSYLSKRIRIPVIYDLLIKFERKEELERFPGRGMIFYSIGIYISLLSFSKDIAMASIMVLALGDSVSHLFGAHYGRIKHPLSKTKFLEGTVAGFIFGFIGAFVFLPFHEAFFASLAAMTFEVVEIKIGARQLDDNLTVPFIAGAVVWLLRLL